MVGCLHDQLRHVTGTGSRPCASAKIRASVHDVGNPWRDSSQNRETPRYSLKSAPAAGGLRTSDSGRTQRSYRRGRGNVEEYGLTGPLLFLCHKLHAQATTYWTARKLLDKGSGNLDAEGGD